MKRKLIPVVLAGLIAATACNRVPSYVIQPDDMAEVLADMRMADAVITVHPSQYAQPSKKMAIKDAIFEKHGITSEQFDTSLVWYGRNTERFSDVNDLTIEILEQRMKEANVLAAGQMAMTVAGDSVDLWNGYPYYVINDKLPTHYLSFSYETDPNWEPVMKKASAIVTNRGGRTCHAAIIARELGIAAVVGCGDATEILRDGQEVTVSCAEGDTGNIYKGLLPFEIKEVRQGELPEIPVKIMMNVGNPQLAFDFQAIPNKGVGLARLEFIINNNIGIHPKACLDYPNLPADLKEAVENASAGYENPREFYKDKIAEGVATIAAAFYPKKVIVRMSDFKSNEYRKLIGGKIYEPEEENPMLGFRGASRYVSEDFKECFAMECEALKKVRDEMGLTNVEIMIPFVRTVREAREVNEKLAEHGLKRGVNGLRLNMMCEIPSNALLAERFLEYFDGFSIGSNDLTQLTLGLDRDSGLIAHFFDERDAAVKVLLSKAIKACREKGAYVGICGQGPSDHPDLAQWLMDEGIESISLNPDTVLNTWRRLAKAKK